MHEVNTKLFYSVPIIQSYTTTSRIKLNSKQVPNAWSNQAVSKHVTLKLKMQLDQSSLDWSSALKQASKQKVCDALHNLHFPAMWPSRLLIIDSVCICIFS